MGRDKKCVNCVNYRIDDKCQSTHSDNSILCASNQFGLYDSNVIHNACDCIQKCLCNQYNDHIVGSYVAQNYVELSEVTRKGNNVVNSTSVDSKNAKNMYGDTKYSHATVIDHYRRIQSTGVSLILDRHRNASTKVPVNNTKLGVGFVCNTSNTNTCYDITEYNCVGNVHTLHATVAHRGLEHHNIGHDCEWDLYDLDFLQCDGVQLPLDYQLVYVHPSKNGKILGFYYFTVVENIGRLMYCSKPPNGALSVWYRTQMYWSVYTQISNGYVDSVARAEAKLAYNNFLDDQHSWHKYGCSYEKYVLHIIDRLIDDCCEPVTRFCLFGVYVAFNTVQVISRRVVGRAEETSTYSWLGFCTVNCRPTASNYQLSHLRP